MAQCQKYMPWPSARNTGCQKFQPSEIHAVEPAKCQKYMPWPIARNTCRARPRWNFWLPCILRWRLRRKIFYGAFGAQVLAHATDATGITSVLASICLWRLWCQLFFGAFGAQGLALDRARSVHRQSFSLAPSAPISFWRLRRPRIGSGHHSRCSLYVCLICLWRLRRPRVWLWI